MSGRVRIAAIVLIVASLFMLVGCSKLLRAGRTHSVSASSSVSTTSTATTSKSTVSTSVAPASNASIPERWTDDALTKAFTAINEKIGANPADYVEVNVTKYSVIVKAIDPQKRQNVDQYTYDGSRVEVAPVDASDNEPGVIEESAFKSDTVKPSVLATVINSAVKDSGVQDVTVNNVTVTKFLADDPQPYLQVSVSGPRASKAVRYNLTTGQFQKVV
jgi:hypothetical protein